MFQLTGLRRERALASTRFRDGRFHNTAAVAPGVQGSPLPLLRELILGKQERSPRHALPLQSPLTIWRQKARTGLRVTWLGHSTLLFEIDGARILTDPVFGERASPLSFLGPRRFHEPPVRLEELPPLDAVLLSHDHYDHLCRSTIRRLAQQRVPFVTSLGVGERLEALGVAPTLITELDWWETHQLPRAELSFTATPAQHFSGRGLFDRNATLWSSWVLRSAAHRVFFSGDTGLTEEFRSVQERLGPFDLTLLEIGAWNAAWGDIHLGPENAFRAFEMLGGGALLPIHWGTFSLALHAWDAPIETLAHLFEDSRQRLLTPVLGQAFEPSEIESFPAWWRNLTNRR